MSYPGISTIENLIEKLMHNELEISIRALKNIETKLNLKTIELNQLDLNSVNKLIFSLMDWIAKINIAENEALVYKAINIAKETLKYTNDLIINNLRSKNILNLISNISNSKISQNLYEICEEFIKVFLSKENNSHSGQENTITNNTLYVNSNNENNNSKKEMNKTDISNSRFINRVNLNNNNFSQEKEQNFTFNNQLNSITTFNNGPININTAKSNINISNTHAFNTYNDNSLMNANAIRNLTDNEFKNDTFHSTAMQKEFTNRTNFTKHSQNGQFNRKKIEVSDVKKNLNLKTNLDENFAINSNNLIANENIIKLEKTFNFNGVSTFPLINISKKEEQVIYDANINLKFGDSIHISKTLNQFYYNILPEYPIEYLLQNSEIIKSILIILEKSNHLEYGNIIFRILERIFNLIEKKIHLFSHNLSTKSITFSNQSKSNKKQGLIKHVFYPGFPEENQSLNTQINKPRRTKGHSENRISTENCVSVRDFLIICAEALIISSYNAEKLPFAVILLEKNFCFLKKLMIDNRNDDEWTIIINQLFKKLYDTILYYKSNQLNFHLLTIVLLRFVLSLSDSAFVKFSTNSNYEIILIIKEIIFIFDDTQSNLVEKTLFKLKRIMSKNSDKQALFEYINDIINEYEKAEIIKVSIDIARRINTNLDDVKQLAKGESRYSKEKYRFIVDNFSNILLAYKYFIDTNEETFMNRVLKMIKKKEDDEQNKYNFNSRNVCSRYSPNTNVNGKRDYDYYNTKKGIENINENSDKEFFLIEFISLSYSYVNSNEYYLNDNLVNQTDNDNVISNNEVSACFSKLISFLNSLMPDSLFKYLTYLDLLTNLKDTENLANLIMESNDILLGLVNDLSQSVENQIFKLEDCILEIIYEVNIRGSISSNQVYPNNNQIKNYSKSSNNIGNNNSSYLFELLPVFPKNMKMLSINAKVEKFLNLNSKLLKYLRLLFSTNELIRLNAINFFKNVFNINSNLNFLEDRIIEYVEFTNNYEKLKKLDPIYSIQTAEKEYENLYNNIISDHVNLQIEFYPLLNILYSNKMDYNMKTAAIEQLIYLSLDKKFTQNFCEEILYFCFDILLNKFNEHKNVFEKKIIFNEDNNEQNENNMIQVYNNLNCFLDEFYKDSNLNYISALMKLINFIILNNTENESIKNFLTIRKNENLINFLHGIIIVLFPCDYIENALNADFKKPRSKHLLNVNLIYFIYLVSFNLKNSFSQQISNNIAFENYELQEQNQNVNEFIKIKKNNLLENYSMLAIQKHYFFNIIPLKNYVSFTLDESQQSSYDNNLNDLIDSKSNLIQNPNKKFKNKWDNYDIKRNIIEFIRFKSFYSQRSSSDQSNYPKVLEQLYDEQFLKNNLLSYLNESGDLNFMEIFINTSKLFEFYLSENFRLLFNNIKSKKINKEKHNHMIKENTENNTKTNINIENTDLDNDIDSVYSKLNYELQNFESKESNYLVQILSFLKCLVPNSTEERNIIIDILNSIKIFLSFYKNFLNFQNPNRKNNLNNSNSNKVDYSNYERYLKDIENSSDGVFLPLMKKGLNDCLYNYLTLICNNKNFSAEFQKNTDYQLFFIEILDLVISYEEIFDEEFYSVNAKSIVFIIKTYINLFYNTDLLNTSRLLVTKLAVNLFTYAISDNDKLDNIKNNSNKDNSLKYTNIGKSFNEGYNNKNILNKLICENKNFINIVIDSIDYFVSNFKHSRIKNLSHARFNKNNNFAEYNEDELGNIQTYYLQDPNSIAFKDVSLLKSNLNLLSKILDFTNFNLIGSNKFFSSEVQIKIATKSFTFLRYFEFESGNEEEDFNNKVYDNIIFSDIIILILNVLEKIKIPEAKLEIIKTNPMILSSLIDFIFNNSAQSILVITIVNFINIILEDLLKNNYSYNKSEFSGNPINNNDYEGKNNQNNFDNSFNDNIKSSQIFDNINPINEYAMSGSSNKYDNNRNNDKSNQECFYNNENFIEEIIILNERIYDISSLMNLLNLIRKNQKISLLCGSLINLLKKLILLGQMKKESNEFFAGNDNQNENYEYNQNSNNNINSNFYDSICNSAFFEIQNEVFKTQIENFDLIINFANQDYLNSFFPVSASSANIQNKNNNYPENFGNSYYNRIYYDKLNSKINKLHEISESLIIIGSILDMFCIVFAKCSNFNNLFENNKIIILENINNLFKIVSMIKSLKSKLNKKDYLLFFEVNGFSDLFKSVTSKFFSLFHILYYNDSNIINEEFLEINLFVNHFNKVNLNEKFQEVDEFNTNYKLKNSFLNIPNKKLDADFDKESSYNNSKIDKTADSNINKYTYAENKSNSKGNALQSNDLIKEILSVKNSKANKFIQVCYELLTLEENDNIEIKVYFAKLLPYLIETVIYFNKKVNELNDKILKFEIYQNNSINKTMNDKGYFYYESGMGNEAGVSFENSFLKLKNEGDTILQLMTGLKQVYNIRYEKNDLKIKVRFDFKEGDLTEKNSLIFAISSLLLVSQTAKKLFIKSNFISTFIDYIKQLSEKLLELNLEAANKEKEFNKFNKSKTTSNLLTKNNNITSISYSKKFNESNDFMENIDDNKAISLEYLISEYNNVLILLQNLFCDFQDCEEKESLFISVDIINQNLMNSNITNISQLNISASKNLELNNNSILSKATAKNNNLGYNTNLNSNYLNTASKTITRNKSAVNNNAIKYNNKGKSIMDNNSNKFDNSKISAVSNSLYDQTGINSNNLASNLLKTLYDIFQDTIRYDSIHINYLKLLINIISKNDHAKKSFIISVSNPEAIGNKDSFIILLLEYLQRKFLNNNLNNTYFSNEDNLPFLDLFIKLLKCLFQNKQIVLFLLKIKFVENFQKDLLSLLSNKKFYSSKSNQICLTYLLDLLISLSFDAEIRKKIADKELIEIFTDAIIKIKNENVVYNILFVLRNLSFVNQNKAHFLANENLLGTIFAILSGEFSLKIKYMISNLLWILLFNNQTLKAILNKEAFKNELIATQLHLQKEKDMKKYMQGEKEEKEEKRKDKLENNEKYLEESCMNFKKIIHILDS